MTASRLQVINLSDISLTGAQMVVQGLDLNFAPTSTFDHFTAIKDLHLFTRCLMLKKWHDQPDKWQPLWSEEEQISINILEELEREGTGDEVKEMHHLKPRSKRFPPLSLRPNVDLFVQLVTKDLRQIPSSVPRDNLTCVQRRAHNELKQMKNIIFKSADKGGNVVMWPKPMYEKEALQRNVVIVMAIRD